MLLMPRVTLPEATPVHETAQLRRDLRRARIEPYAWIINQSLTPLGVTDPLLCQRQLQERRYIHEVTTEQARRTALVPWQVKLPVGAGRLRAMVDSLQSAVPA